MPQSPSALANWLDDDFYNRGAVLTSTDLETVTFAKGGTFTIVEKFLEIDAPVFYLKDFYENQYLAYVPSSFLTLGKASVLSYFKNQSETHTHISPVGNDDDLYEKDFQLLKASFNKDLEKAVLVSREYYEGFEGKRTIRRLLRRAFEFGAGIPYGLWNESYGVMGSTPEVLYEVKGERLSTFALAGTGKTGEEEKLLNSAKDFHEHEVVVRDIKEKLEAFTTDLTVYQTKILPFKNIIHLKTIIDARVESSIDYTSLTNALSPTAALGGYPKAESLRFLKGTRYSQKHPQRYFGSCFGLISKMDKTFIVSIRNVQWEDKALFIESGGGIVSASEFQKELEEIHLKRDSIRKHYL